MELSALMWGKRSNLSIEALDKTRQGFPLADIDLCKRVRRYNSGAEGVIGHLGVDFCRCYAGMPEKALNQPYVDAFLNEQSSC